MAIKTLSAFYFVVFNRANGIYGYTWRVGTSGTSFYIKARAQPLGSMKISLHGPDPRPNLKPGFKVTIDRSALPKVLASGGDFVDYNFGQNAWFTGRPVTSKVTHVATFRYTPDLFAAGVPSAPPPGTFKPPKEAGYIISSPELLRVADIDFYISNGAPYWWNSVQAFKDNSCFGPIRNKAGQYLTCQSMRRPISESTFSVMPWLRFESPEASVRSVVSGVDQRSMLMVSEHWVPRSLFTR